MTHSSSLLHTSAVFFFIKSCIYQWYNILQLTPTSMSTLKEKPHQPWFSLCNVCQLLNWHWHIADGRYQSPTLKYVQCCRYPLRYFLRTELVYDLHITCNPENRNNSKVRGIENSDQKNSHDKQIQTVLSLLTLLLLTTKINLTTNFDIEYINILNLNYLNYKYLNKIYCMYS